MPVTVLFPHRMKRTLKNNKVFDWIINMLMTFFNGFIGLFIVWFFVQLLLVATFEVPTESMSPTIFSGDYLLVNKATFGARIFNVFDTFEGHNCKIDRLPGLREIKRNDILVFNNPYVNSYDSISFDVMKYMVKRCIALPGDTLSISDGSYHVHGYDSPVGNVSGQRLLSNFIHAELALCHETIPGYRCMRGWNLLDWGPMYIPQQGDSLSMDPLTLHRYRRIIEWETGKKLMWSVDHYILDGHPCHGYRFKHNYYFMVGDNALESYDSRQLGPVPEEFIVGIACRIWMSRDPYNHSIRWRRVWKSISEIVSEK